MGEWHKVVIDECLPLRIYPKERAGKPPRRGRTFRPDEVEDYWALLLEKAFAKFVGGYMNLEGGFPRCAVTHLSGGITTSDMLNENNNDELLEYLQTDEVFNYLESIEDDSMIILSNYEGGSEMGIQPGHAYAIQDFENIGDTKLVQLRNPWGEGEWLGEWGDDWLVQNIETDRRLRNLTYHQRKKLGIGIEADDGVFWMSWADALEEFEQITICHLDGDDGVERRCIGTFNYDQSDSPDCLRDLAQNYLNPSRHVQLNLTVEKKQHVKFQLCLDMNMKPKSNEERRLTFFAVHRLPEELSDPGYPFDSLELYDLELVRPKFPFRQTPICTKGYAFEPYDYNGWVYDLEPGNYCVIFNTTPMIPQPSDNVQPTDFILRACGSGLEMQQIE